MNRLIQLMDAMELELNGRKGLINRRVDLNKCIEIFEEIKKALPPSLKEAETVLSAREKILSSADTVAKNTIKEAEERALHLAENSQITRLAEKQGRDILDKAYRECDSLVQKTKEHLDKMFADAEAFFHGTLNLIKTNRNELRGALLSKDN